MNIENTMNIHTPQLSIYIGPMFAGKSSKLIELYNIAIQQNLKPLVVTHTSETRYSNDGLSTHNNITIDCVKYNSIELLMADNFNLKDNYDVVFIDEAQFFSDLTKCVDIVDKWNKSLYVFGLDGDFKRNKFGTILDLIPYCDYIEKIKATCNKCSSHAIFSHKLISDTNQVLIGSNDVYESLCRKCYLKN